MATAKTTKKKKGIIEQDAATARTTDVTRKYFSSENSAFIAGKEANLSGKAQNWEDAYAEHDNRGSNLHAIAAFKKKFRLGWESVGVSTCTA